MLYSVNDIRLFVREQSQDKPATATGYGIPELATDVTALLAQLGLSLNVPILVIASEYDQADPVEHLQTELLPLLPGAEWVVVPDADQLALLEAPTEVAHLIDTFVQRLDLA